MEFEFEFEFVFELDLMDQLESFQWSSGAGAEHLDYLDGVISIINSFHMLKLEKFGQFRNRQNFYSVIKIYWI